MESPRQFNYGPRWGLILPFFLAGTALIALAAAHLISSKVGLGLAFFPLAFASAGALARLAFPRFLELGQTSLSISPGLLRPRITVIPYDEIWQVSEVVRGRMSVLQLRTKHRTFEIVSTLLPDQASYVAVRDFVNSRIRPEARGRENQPQRKEPGKYCFKCSYEGNGQIFASNGERLWRVETQHFGGRPRYPYGVFRVPDFVVYGQDDKEALRVRLERKWPLARFVMLENESPVCTIRLRSLLRNKYTLAFADGQNWVFTMPLFTVLFRGRSESGKEIRVRLWSHNLWYVLIDPSADTPQLVAALAFLHRERLRFN